MASDRKVLDIPEEAQFQHMDIQHTEKKCKVSDSESELEAADTLLDMTPRYIWANKKPDPPFLPPYEEESRIKMITSVYNSLFKESTLRVLLAARADLSIHEEDLLYIDKMARDVPLAFAPSKQVADLLIKARANPNESVAHQPSYPASILHNFVSKDATDIVESLVNASADVEVRDKADCTALFHACKQGNPKMTSILLSAGANPNTASSLYDCSALTVAIGQGHEECVKLLIKNKASVNATEKDSPLANAIKWNNGVRLLLAAKAEVDAKALAALHERHPWYDYVMTKLQKPTIVFDIDGVLAMEHPLSGRVKTWVPKVPHKALEMVQFKFKHTTSSIPRAWFAVVDRIIKWGWRIALFSSGDDTRNQAIRNLLAKECGIDAKDIVVKSRDDMVETKSLTKEKAWFQGTHTKCLAAVGFHLQQTLLVENDKSYVSYPDEWPGLVIEDSNESRFWRKGQSHLCRFPTLPFYVLGVLQQCHSVMAVKKTTLRKAICEVRPCPISHDEEYRTDSMRLCNDEAFEITKSGFKLLFPSISVDDVLSQFKYW